MRWMLMLLTLAACGGPEPVETTLTAIRDVCVDGDELVVDFEGCLSSSCDTLLSASCEVDFDGAVVDVSGEAVVRREGDVCTDDCGFIEARCPVPADADRDTVILTFGGDDGGPVLADAACQD